MRSLRKRLAGDRGVALPVTVSVMFMVAGLATVTARAAITSDHQSLRDRNVKQAIQAANAGLEAAMYRTNLMQPGSLQCALKNVSSGNLQRDGRRRRRLVCRADRGPRERSELLGPGLGRRAPCT